MRGVRCCSIVPGAVAGFVFAATLGASGVGAQQAAPPAPRPDITVSAIGTVQVRPDQAVLLLAVETTGKEAQEAARENATKMQRILDALRKLDVAADHIRTVSYALDPQYARQQPGPQAQDQEPRIVGYRAANMVQVTLAEIDKVGRAVDAGIGAGANRVAGLSYGVKDESKPRLEALRRAMESAGAQAQALAQAAGRGLGPLLHVSTGEGSGPPPRPMMRLSAVEVAPSTPAEPGELTVTATVIATFALAVEP